MTLRVLMLSKACIVGTYQRKLEAIAQQEVELVVLVPPAWVDERGKTPLERVHTEGYSLETLPIAFNGNFHLHYYRGLGEHIRRFRPDIVHIDEEPYNLATWQALYHARRMGAKSLFFSWQNINRRYPPPFSWGQRWVLENIDYALVGTDSAAIVWREKGYQGPLAVIPQFGVDPESFKPAANPLPERPFTIGYFGRLVEEKGIHHLLEAVTQLEPGSWRLRIVGSGPFQSELEATIARCSITDYVQIDPLVPSTEMPALYQQLDTFVLPSLTRPNWKEQFGRVLIEALASGVPVVGSDSGAIPSVIGDVGWVFPEGDVGVLTFFLRELQANPGLRTILGEKCRTHAQAHFTHQQIATQTVAVYHEMMANVGKD